MKLPKTVSVLCAVMALLMLCAVPCSAAEEAFSQWKTIPTEDCEMNVYTVEKSPLYKKTAVFFGDSLCNASGESNSSDPTVKAKAGYAGRIGTKYSMTYYKEGVSGSAYAASGRSKIGAKISSFQQAHANEKIDYVILEGGVNDAWDQVALGAVSDSFKKTDFNTATFAGAVEAALYDVKEFFPQATVGFIIVYKMPIAYYGGQEIAGLRDNAKMEPYMNMLIEICEKWEVPYIDFYHDDAFNNTVFKTDTNEYLSDGIHMESAGYDVISDYIAAWMEEPVRRVPQPQKPVPQPEPEEPTNPNEGVTSEPTEDLAPTPSEPDNSRVGKIIAIAAGAVVAVAAVATVVTVLLRKKKKS